MGVRGENMPAGPNIEDCGGEECGEMDPPKLFMTLDGVNFIQYSITILKIYLKHFRDEICITGVRIIIRSQKKNKSRETEFISEI